MNSHLFYKTLSIVLGLGLIIACFMIFGASLEKEIRILDIIVCCLIYTQLAQLFIFPMIALEKKGHKEVGMMGIHYFVLSTCCIASIFLMSYGIAYSLSFKFQLIGQLIILFFMLIGRATALSSGNKVLQIHEQEQVAQGGKKSMRADIAAFLEDLALHPDIRLDADVIKRLFAVQESLKYLPPSFSQEAVTLERRFSQTLSDLQLMLRDTTLNASRIETAVLCLEQIVKNRKQL